MKRVAIFLGIIQVFVAIGAIPAGLSMIFEPDGTGVGMSTEMLANSPFQNFFIPGLFLFIVNGLFNTIGAYLSFRKIKYAGELGLCLGFVLIMWIVVQVYFIGLTFFLQPLFFIVGIAEMFLGYSFISRIKLINSK